MLKAEQLSGAVEQAGLVLQAVLETLPDAADAAEWEAAVQQIEGHVLQPMLQSRSMSLHPVLVLLGIAAGSEGHGVVGGFLAVPVVATIAVLFLYVGEQIDLRAGTISADDLEYRNPMSPWDGVTLAGIVEATYVHGALAYRRGLGVLRRAGREILAPAPGGVASGVRHRMAS